jgi:hypothetical protein
MSSVVELDPLPLLDEDWEKLLVQHRREEVVDRLTP